MCWQGGKKLAGILLEAEAVAGDRLAVVVGIGTNVVAAPEGTPTPATSLAALGVADRRRGFVRGAVGLLGRISRHLGRRTRV